MRAMLIFPNQLYITEHSNYVHIYIEDEHFFNGGIHYHKHKLMLHRSSMKFHFENLDANKRYIEYPTSFDNIKKIISEYEEVYAYDPINHEMHERYSRLGIKWLESLNFMTDSQTLIQYFNKKNRYFMYDFYVFQRKRLDILMENGKPIGLQYSFDTENRKKLPKSIVIPELLIFKDSSFVLDAARFVDEVFPNNPGSTKNFNHPTTREEALKQLNQFIEEKLNLFGPYQDAISDLDPLLFHSNISSSLNIGLLSPNEVIDRVIKKDSPLASKEGFVRQIIGWREFVRGVYLIKGREMIQQNYLNHTRKFSDAWYLGTTGIPVADQAIKKFMDNAYTHHIERLMIIGNLMMLLNIDPNEVYRYFMELSIDGYEWVMVPNIYGMSQFACGEFMTTKPYFSGSNYLKKMGAERGEWENTWDALFYMFIKEHREIIKSNPRLNLLIMNLDKKTDEEMRNYEKLKQDCLVLTTKN